MPTTGPLSGLTAQSLINNALMRSGLQSINDPVDGTVNAVAFQELNLMLDAWSSELSPLYNLIDSQVGAPTPGFTLIGGQAVYTIGTPYVPLVTYLGIRPPKIMDIYLIDGNNVSYYQDIIDFDPYVRLIYKVAPGRPDRCYVNYQENTVTLTFYPTPAYTDAVHVMYLAPLNTFVTTADSVIVPFGYQDTFINGFAIRLAAYFGKQPPPYVVQQYVWGKNIINRNNEAKYLLQNPMPTQKRRFFNILTGGTV